MCLLKGEFALEKIAVIQLGVTKIDLVLADILPEGNFVVREEMSETVKIGSDLEADGLIRTARISEAMAVLKMYKTFCDVCKVTHKEVHDVLVLSGSLDPRKILLACERPIRPASV